MISFSLCFRRSASRAWISMSVPCPWKPPESWWIMIRAFGTAPKGAESTTFVVLKALDYAAAHGAQIINMSFAGPKDPLIERGIAAAAAKGIVMVAASGNAGPKSPPLKPAGKKIAKKDNEKAQKELF